LHYGFKTTSTEKNENRVLLMDSPEDNKSVLFAVAMNNVELYGCVGIEVLRRRGTSYERHSTPIINIHPFSRNVK